MKCKLCSFLQCKDNNFICLKDNELSKDCEDFKMDYETFKDFKRFNIEIFNTYKNKYIKEVENC